jgi:CheY-like chemotaxis protein
MKEKSFASLPVFLVDDEESVLHATAAVLHSAGVANIQMVSDSRELLPALERQPASAVLLDLFMPHITGNKLLPDIVHLYPEVPVIVMTAALGCRNRRAQHEGRGFRLPRQAGRGKPSGGQRPPCARGALAAAADGGAEALSAVGLPAEQRGLCRHRHQQPQDAGALSSTSKRLPFPPSRC